MWSGKVVGLQWRVQKCLVWGDLLVQSRRAEEMHVEEEHPFSASLSVVSE